MRSSVRRGSLLLGELFRVALAQQRTERLHEQPGGHQRVRGGSRTGAGRQRLRQVQHPDAAGLPGGGRSSSGPEAEGRVHQLRTGTGSTRGTTLDRTRFARLRARDADDLLPFLCSFLFLFFFRFVFFLIFPKFQQVMRIFSFVWEIEMALKLAEQ